MIAPDIFQVEDDIDFTFIMEYAVKEVDKNISLKITSNGNEALTALKGMAETGKKPGLILLDYNLPGLSGLEILKSIKEMHYFDSVPIVIFSTSDNPKDIESSMAFGATAFRTKPMGYRALVNSLKAMQGTWLNY
ncbi:response regulator [Mucilaginibacter sp. PAMC 26640]|nr:response regulator [Mucilaginibacter sp. PAMC 26640]